MIACLVARSSSTTSARAPGILMACAGLSARAGRADSHGPLTPSCPLPAGLSATPHRARPRRTAARGRAARSGTGRRRGPAVPPRHSRQASTTNTAPSANAAAEIDHPERPDHPGHERQRHQHNRIREYLPRGRARAADHRHHRDPCRGVLALEQQRERPEVRRRPQQHDHEQVDRAHPEVAVGRGPARQRRDRAGGAPDHDVLRRRSLQPQRVHDHVVRASGQRQQSREHDCRMPLITANESASSTSANATARLGLIRPAATGREAVRGPISRSMSRSITWLSALAPPHASPPPITNATSAGSAGRAPRRGDHRAHRGQHQQRHDPRLGQRHVVAPRRGPGAGPPRSRPAGAAGTAGTAWTLSLTTTIES